MAAYSCSLNPKRVEPEDADGTAYMGELLESKQESATAEVEKYAQTIEHRSAKSTGMSRVSSVSRKTV
jgi:hypothetical protein